VDAVSTERPLLVIAASRQHFLEWCWEQGFGREEAAYVERPADLEDATRCRLHHRPEVAVVDLSLLGGYPWEAMLLAVRMELDGHITLRNDQSPSGRDFLEKLVIGWAAKCRERTS
jgi:hypothetical protein